MKTIRVRVDDATHRRLVQKRRIERVPTVSALLLKGVGELNEQSEANEIVKSGMKKARQRSSGTNFRLRDLFSSSRWNGFSKGARLRAGRMFIDQVNAAVDGIRAAGKSPSNHQLYTRA